jgi:dolichol-phosphate mannosyltransferase
MVRRPLRTLIAIPVYNEQRYVQRVLELVLEYAGAAAATTNDEPPARRAWPSDDCHAQQVLVIDDGSTDATPTLLAQFPVEVIRHSRNRGYGRSMMDAFRWAAVDNFDWVITMDCDEQHEPAAIPRFMEAVCRDDLDVVSGSRYIHINGGDHPPPDRRAINAQITQELNARLGLKLTDSFCGFKAYRVEALKALSLDVDGYAFPMQFWVQAVAAGLRIGEIPVKLIYNDLNRSFGGPLDDAQVRLNHYRCVLHRELRRCADRLPKRALADTCTKLVCE